MPLTTSQPGEMKTTLDPLTGRTIRQLTAGAGHEYHLYYQTYPYTRDGRWLVFYSRRDGRTDLYRLDRRDGTVARLTFGRAEQTGWWPWTDMAGEGVYDYIACLDPDAAVVYYHDADGLHALDLAAGTDRLLCTAVPGHRPLSQLSCAWSGRFVATAWAPQAQALAAQAAQRAALEAGENYRQSESHWRDIVRSRLDLIDTRTGEVRTLLKDFPSPLHNLAITPDDNTVIAVSAPNPGSLLMVDCNRPGTYRELSPPDRIGRYCHYHAARTGKIAFDANLQDPQTLDLQNTYLGWVRPDGSDLQAWPVGPNSYCHVGHDPEGKLLFASVDNHNDTTGHHLAIVQPAPAGQARLERLTANLPSGIDQFCHAHPVLSPDRRAILYTARGNDNRTHLFEVDIDPSDDPATTH